MRDMLRQASSLWERNDLPLPSGVIPPGTAPVVAVAAEPKHPSNVVLVQLRRDGGPATFLRALPEAAPLQAGQQWYQAALPTLGEGHRIDYRIELVRAGQRLAALPADGSWLTMIGGSDRATHSRERGAADSAEASPSSRAPLWAYDLTFLGTLTAKLRPEVIGETPEGYRINFFIESGRIVGPRIDAVILPEGGDWMCIRPDGVGMVDIRITYETIDGALIYDRAGGVFDIGPSGYAQVAAGQFTGSPPFYATPTFMTAHPDWMWLNRCQGFGIGRVVLEDLQVQCDIYIPEVLDRLRDG